MLHNFYGSHLDLGFCVDDLLDHGPNVRRRDASVRGPSCRLRNARLAAPVISTRLLRDRSSATGFWIEADLMANPQVIDDVKPALAALEPRNP